MLFSEIQIYKATIIRVTWVPLKMQVPAVEEKAQG